MAARGEPGQHGGEVAAAALIGDEGLVERRGVGAERRGGVDGRGRLLAQRDSAWTLLNAIPGVDCVKPGGALYLFPRLDPEVYDIRDDERLVQDLLLQYKILVVQGTAFNWPRPDHFRIVSLPAVEQLAAAVEQIGDFLARYQQ